MKGRASRRILIWADKIALSLALFGLLLLAVIWLAGIAVAGEVGAQHLLASIGSGTVDACGLAIVSLWVAMRGIDLLAGGQTFRVFKSAARVIWRKPAAQMVPSDHRPPSMTATP